MQKVKLTAKADLNKVREYIENQVFSEIDGVQMTYELMAQEVIRVECYRSGSRFCASYCSDWLRGLPSGMAHAFMWNETVALVEKWTGTECDWDKEAGMYDEAYWELLGKVLYEGGKEFA